MIGYHSPNSIRADSGPAASNMVSGSRGVLYRPCLERNCPNLTSGSRCALHARRSTDSRPSSSRRGYDRDYQRKRVALLGNGARCVYCGKPATTVDHVKPLALGGSNADSNLAPCCARCNYSRGARLKNRGVRR